MIETRAGVTELLAGWRNGDAEAGEVILAMLYDELRSMAARQLRGEAPGHTLQPTALVHEVYLRLARGREPGASDRAHLLAIAARVMRQVLVNHALARRTARRGGDRLRIGLDAAVDLFEERCRDLVALDEALTRLGEEHPRAARVVELRFFGGLTMEETAAALEASVRTVERDWTMARCWLRGEVAA
jgi:RNA polymerase sigma factor (TIGR02999 family)